MKSPASPPFPDLTGLSPEELLIISAVMRKHEEFEEMERSRTKELEAEVHDLESRANGDGLHKPKKSIDLHLCRLCHRSKFVDGIGRVCNDCQKRVCNNCGWFTADKIHRTQRGKWRCRLCHLKRDILCKSGGWFPRDDDSHRDSLVLDGRDSHANLSTKHGAVNGGGNRTDSELLDNSTLQNQEKSNRGHRRRPIKSVGSMPTKDDDEQYISERQFIRDREHERKRRSNQMRNKKRVVPKLPQNSSTPTPIPNPPTYVPKYSPRAQFSRRQQLSFESDCSDRTNPSNSEINEGDISDLSVTPSRLDDSFIRDHAPRTRRRESTIKERDSVFASSNTVVKSDRVKFPGADTDESQTTEKQLDSQTDDCNAKQTLSRGDSLTEDHTHTVRIKRQDAMSCSSSSASIVSEIKQCHTADVGKRKMSIVDHSQIKPSKVVERPKHRLPLNLESTRNSKIFLSLPDRDSVQPGATTSYTENLLTPPTPTYRRISLSQCQNLSIKAQQDDDESRSIPSNPHQVILHKDRNDKTCRTGGLGMRVVGGKQMDDGTIGALVAMVVPGGPADVQGNITVGDRLLQWNGRSLVGATFEETKQISDAAGDIVQLVVLYSDIDDKLRIRSQTPEPEMAMGIPKSDSADATILANVDDPTNDSESTSHYVVHKPKRRMLPKTPIEIKRETRHISGRLLAQIEYAGSCDSLKIGLLRAEGIKPRAGSQKKLPRPSVMIHLLPNRSELRRHETHPSFDTTTPEWNSTFVFHHITRDHIQEAAIEITVWDHNATETENEFLGEVLLDLKDANLTNDAIWYSLEDHDENSSPLPSKDKVKFDAFSTQSSTCSSADLGLPRQASVSSVSPSPAITPPTTTTKALGDTRTLPVTPSDRRKSSVRPRCLQHRELKARKDSAMPRDSPTNSDHESRVSLLRNADLNRDSFTKKVKRKMTNAVSKVSSGLHVADKAKDSDDDSGHRSRSLSVTELDVGKRTGSLSPASIRRSTIHMELLAPPRPMSCSSNNSTFYDDVSEDEKLLAGLSLPSPDRPPPEGDDITSVLGPGQVAPKPAMEKVIRGDMKLAFMVSKGQLEVDIICVKSIKTGSTGAAPDTYVKTYLIEGSKIIQKKKTKVIKSSLDPMYRQKLKYSACNVHGRSMKVNVWEKQKAFDKKGCLGEVVVKLDNLTLSEHTMGWYKMFQVSATELGSTESLVHW